MAPNLPPDRRPIVISGPSGVGKGTLFKMLFAQHPDTFTLSVSHTTRSPREGEQHAVDYHFVSHAEFESLIDADGFVEHAKFGGNRYGTSKSTIREQGDKGKVVVLDIEMEGVKQIKASSIPARFVFVAPPSEDELEKRLRGRGTEKEESIQKRLAQAKYVILGAHGAHCQRLFFSLAACTDMSAQAGARVLQDSRSPRHNCEFFFLPFPALFFICCYS